MRYFQVIKDYFHLASGTILQEKDNGDYFTPMTDEQAADSGLSVVTVAKEVVLWVSDEYFREIIVSASPTSTTQFILDGIRGGDMDMNTAGMRCGDDILVGSRAYGDVHPTDSYVYGGSVYDFLLSNQN